MYFLYGNPSRSLPEQWFTTTVLLRDVAVDGSVCVGDSPDLPAGGGFGAMAGRVEIRRAESTIAPLTRHPAGCRSGCGLLASRRPTVPASDDADERSAWLSGARPA